MCGRVLLEGSEKAESWNRNIIWHFFIEFVLYSMSILSYLFIFYMLLFGNIIFNINMYLEIPVKYFSRFKYISFCNINVELLC